MDLEMIILSEVNLMEKTRSYMTSLTRGTQNTTQVNKATKHKQIHSHREETCGHQGGRLREGRTGSVEFTDANLYIEWINSRSLLYSTGNSIQYPVIRHNRKESYLIYILKI